MLFLWYCFVLGCLFLFGSSMVLNLSEILDRLKVKTTWVVFLIVFTLPLMLNTWLMVFTLEVNVPMWSSYTECVDRCSALRARNKEAEPPARYRGVAKYTIEYKSGESETRLPPAVVRLDL